MAMALVVVACTGEKSTTADTAAVEPVKAESGIKTFDDSVAYFMGQDMAIAYWNMAKMDSIMAGDENAKEFAKGLEAGIKAAKESTPYAVGLQQGMAMYANMQGMNDRLNTKLGVESFLEGFEMAMESDKAVDPIKFQADMSEIESRLNTMAMNVVNAASDSTQNK